MNDKLSLQDLVDLLSKKAKITKKDADSFCRELFQLVLDRIFENDSVKIKDFGTFKLISVSSRESVNVNTGEKIEIPSHYKLSFIPDKVLKNLVNKPFSQFETILLEDGVIFETSVENDENLSEDDLPDNEDREEENDDEDILTQIQQPIIGKPAPESLDATPSVEAKDTPKTNEQESPLKSQGTLKQQIYPQSFVYTYTTSKPSDEPASITLTVPLEEILSTPVPPAEEKAQETVIEARDEEAPESKEFVIELLDLPHVPLEAEKTEANSKENLDSTDDSQIEEVVKDNVLQPVPLSIALPKLPKSTISDDLELESDFDSEIETEEDVIIPIPIVSRHEQENKPSIDTAARDKLEVEKKRVFSDEDPERPLFPVEESNLLTDTDFVPLHSSEDKEIEVVSPTQKHPVKDADNSLGDDDSIETDTELFFNVKDTDNAPYPDFHAPADGFQWRKWLPVMIFVAVIVAFLSYGLVKMLNKPYGFEHNLYRTNFSLSDSLLFVDEESPEVQETDALLDSIKKAQAQPIKEPEAEPLSKEAIVPIAKQPAVEEKMEALTADITGADSLTREVLKAGKSGFVISDKLKFGILNKAGFHLEKYKSEESPESNPDRQEKTAAVSAQNIKPKYASIKRGTTLRTLATTHYGSPEYWVYIYQANKKNIANPNNVPIGTTLLIPPLSAYGITNPKDAKARQAAKNIESKILRGR